jgi:hypothetical protein
MPMPWSLLLFSITPVSRELEELGNLVSTQVACSFVSCPITQAMSEYQGSCAAFFVSCWIPRRPSQSSPGSVVVVVVRDCVAWFECRVNPSNYSPFYKTVTISLVQKRSTGKTKKTNFTNAYSRSPDTWSAFGRAALQPGCARGMQLAVFATLAHE